MSGAGPLILVSFGLHGVGVIWSMLESIQESDRFTHGPSQGVLLIIVIKFAFFIRCYGHSFTPNSFAALA